MFLRYLALICLILCALILQNGWTQPAKCTEQLHYTEWTQKYFDESDAVFIGRVITEEMPDKRVLFIQPGSDPPSANSMAELIEEMQSAQANAASVERVQEATFDVDKAWKGLIGPTIAVKAQLLVDDTGHHPTFWIDESYLVFAYKSESDTFLRVPVGCAFRSSVDETRSKIRILDALTKKP